MSGAPITFKGQHFKFSSWNWDYCINLLFM